MMKRDYNADLVRVVAVLSVLSVHFFLNNGFYDQICVGKRMYVATVMRSAFMICVPLFILLTGYLMNKKEYSVKYFLNIKKVLIVYLLSMLMIMLYEAVRYQKVFLLKDIISNITNYAYYSWYIEMYIGLYLLIPFINLAYNNLKNKAEKGGMCIVLFIITAGPSLVNSFGGMKILPEWWANIYPLTYYVIGAYIAEYKDEIKFPLKLNFVCIAICFLLAGTLSYAISYNTTFLWLSWNNFGGFTNVLSATAVFLFLIKINITDWNPAIHRVIRFVAKISLPIYLLSYIADDIWYSVLNNNVLNPLDRFFYYLPTVGCVFVTSVCLASVVHFIDTLPKRVRKIKSNGNK